ncbi:hypothetical protein [Putridiphycobacter roseus]|nr:hypothetical protein [Putridiphycobacter roseus]
MKSKIHVIVCLLVVFSSCSKQEWIDPKFLENAGSATLLYKAEVFKETDSSFILQSSFLDIQNKVLGTKEKQKDFNFDLNLGEDTPYLRICDSISHSTSLKSPSINYFNLMLINPENAKTRMYHEATGFFLEAYRKEAISHNNEFYIGYWNNQNLDVLYPNNTNDTTLMQVFYANTHMVSQPKLKSPNEIPYPIIPITEVLNLLNKAADEIINHAPLPSVKNRYITYINYSKITDENFNPIAFNNLITKFTANGIQLNVINYQNTPILLPLVFRSGGFSVNNYNKRVGYSDTEDGVAYFETKMKATNVVLQNLEKLLRKGNLQIENYFYRVCKTPINNVDYSIDYSLETLELYIDYGINRFLVHPIYN